MLTERQEEILNYLVKEYIGSAEPISSGLLKKKCGLDISPATIRNELQDLTEKGYIEQPHTSSGRVPTDKAYKYFVEVISNDNKTPDLKKEIEIAKQKIENELILAQKLTRSLQEISTTLSYTRIQNKNAILEILRIIGPSQATYDKNINLITEIIKELENF